MCVSICLIVSVIKLYYVSTLSSIITVLCTTHTHDVVVLYVCLQMKVVILLVVENLAAVETMRKFGKAKLNSSIERVCTEKKAKHKSTED